MIGIIFHKYFVIISKHSGAINDIQFHPFHNLIVSSGDDHNVALGLYTDDNYYVTQCYTYWI